MPWEKNFDLDEATDKAIKVFWKKGYEGTSMSDLIEGMGINKGSLYNAFGSKKKLFDRALLRYDSLNRQKAITQLSAFTSPVEAIETLFEGLVSEAREDGENKGCLLVNTAQELPNHSGDIQVMVKDALIELEEFFRSMILKGHDLGEIPKSVDADDIARSLLAQVLGLRILARGAYDAEQLAALKTGVRKLIS